MSYSTHAVRDRCTSTEPPNENNKGHRDTHTRHIVRAMGAWCMSTCFAVASASASWIPSSLSSSPSRSCAAHTGASVRIWAHGGLGDSPQLPFDQRPLPRISHHIYDLRHSKTNPERERRVRMIQHIDRAIGGKESQTCVDAHHRPLQQSCAHSRRALCITCVRPPRSLSSMPHSRRCCPRRTTLCDLPAPEPRK